jgi:hypothetical protein
MPREDLIQLRRGPAATWTSDNPILDAGEEGWETDTGRGKTGDGSTPWNSLYYDRSQRDADGTVHDAEIPASIARVADVDTALAAKVDEASGLVVVAHGAVAGTARPAGAAVVYWVGSVTPTNAIDQDLFYDTSA